jgi:hypothetical protein
MRRQIASHVALRSLNSSPCNVADADVRDHVKLQSLYSAPRDLIPATSRSSCLGQLGLADYMLQPSETHCFSPIPESTEHVSRKLPPVCRYNDYEDESLYSLARYPAGGYPDQFLSSPRNEYTPRSESRLYSLGSDRMTHQETFTDPVWSAFKSPRRSTCPELPDLHHRNLPLSQGVNPTQVCIYV